MTMSTRDQFEKLYAEQHDLPAETFEQYRMGDSYRLPAISKAWRWFCHGMDALKPQLEMAQDDIAGLCADLNRRRGMEP